jgi:hypothetical protein
MGAIFEKKEVDMKTPLKWIVSGAIAAIILVALGTAARASDDFAVFTLEKQSRVGQVVLEPGVYAFRAVDGEAGKLFVRVTNADENRSYVLLPALRLSVARGEMAQETRLTWDQSEPSRLLKWEIGNKGYAFYFPTHGLEP